MPYADSTEYIVDNKALDAFLLSKGLTRHSSKYWAVRMRHLHKFRRVRQ